MSDADDLKEFNQKVKGGVEKAIDGVAITRAIRAHLQERDEYDDRSEVDASEHDSAKIMSSAKMWSRHGKDFFPCEEALSTIPPGIYTSGRTNAGISFFCTLSNETDDLILLPDSASEDVIRSIETFWTKEEHYRKFGFLWKRGALLWGPPGSGKTSTIQLISKQIISRGGLVLHVTNPHCDAKALETLRQIEPVRPIIVLMEDIDAIVKNFGESDVLALLDGELQIDNVVFIATTNYPERLDKRLLNRPSRFDIVKKIGMPSAEAREIYLSHKNPRLKESERELKEWVKQTQGYSIAHLKEVIVSVEVFEIPFADAIERLNAMIGTSICSDDYENENKTSFGFVSGESEY